LFVFFGVIVLKFGDCCFQGVVQGSKAASRHLQLSGKFGAVKSNCKIKLYKLTARHNAQLGHSPWCYDVLNWVFNDLLDDFKMSHLK
jgi:hypothetical protein